METLTVPELLKLPESMNSTVCASIQVRLVACAGFVELTPVPEIARSFGLIELGSTNPEKSTVMALPSRLAVMGPPSASARAADGERGGRYAEGATDRETSRAIELEGADVGRAGPREATARNPTRER